MKILLVTVAGTSSRFRASLGYDCLKCIYYKDNIESSLLYRLLHQDVEFDKYIIVGGFMYDTLKQALDMYFQDMLSDIVLIENEKYRDYGSGYSLYLGMQEAVEMGFEELIFAEGDLYFDAKGFRDVYDARQNVITCNKQMIHAGQSVAFYFDTDKQIHYIYDTGHQAFYIKEPFTAIYNSGQVWKFIDCQRVRDSIACLNENEIQGTNLTLVQQYFSGLAQEQYCIVEFAKWMNCNTIYDFNKMDDVQK